MPYLHLPVQSGSDRVLEAMNRRHGARRLPAASSSACARARPDIALSSDFIVGFPGETRRRLRRHAARWSRRSASPRPSPSSTAARPGTPAAAMPDQVPEAVKAARLRALQALLDAQAARLQQRQGRPHRAGAVRRAGPQAGPADRQARRAAVGPCRRRRSRLIGDMPRRVITASQAMPTAWPARSPASPGRSALSDPRHAERRGGAGQRLRSTTTPCCAMLFGQHDRNLARIEQSSPMSHRARAATSSRSQARDGATSQVARQGPAAASTSG